MSEAASSVVPSALGKPRGWLVLGILVVLAAVWEISAQLIIIARVPTLHDWQAAAELVRSEHQAGDAISVAPRWADPILRNVLGDRITIADAGRSDNAGRTRLWGLTIRGAAIEGAPSGRPELEREFGGVTVLRWSLPRERVVDLTSRITDARVDISIDGAPAHPCTLRPMPPQRGGGLDQGPFAPTRRFICDSRPWLWVGTTVIEDLELRPRTCVWQHPPPGGGPVRATFSNVPAGHLSLYGGLHWVQERWRSGGRVEISIRNAAGEEVGHMTHRDGDGWKHMEAIVPAGDLSIEVSAPEGDHNRTFCWAAHVREGA